GEPIAAAAALSAFYLLATCGEKARPSRALAAGALAGWAVLNQFPMLVVACLLALYAATKLRSWVQVSAFAGGASATAALLLAYNWAAFGDPLFVSYQAYALASAERFPEQASGFVGLTTPRLRIVWNVLGDPQRGLYFANPVLLLALPGLWCWRRRGTHRAEFAVAALAIASLVIFNASYGESIVSWGGGTATGPRQIVAAVPFMVLSFAFLPRATDWLLAILAVASAFLMLIATATDPHFPYEYANPLWDFAMQNYLRGSLALNSDAFFGGGAIFDGTVAFNLGRLAGLPPWIQLWPLALFWTVGAVLLIRLLARTTAAPPNRVASVAAALVVFAMVAPTALRAPVQHLALRQRHGLLGSYYAGERCDSSPVSLERIDRIIDFADVATLGALKFPSCVKWSGRLIAPRSGEYSFGVEVDDSAWVTIDGRPVIPDVGLVNFPRADGRIRLAAGLHDIEVGLHNIAGDAAIHLYWVVPGQKRALISAGALLPPAITAKPPS
ncbi:MAG: PA14 domain-containing protein, partial [Candidatus Binataceae bacterium]